MSRVREGPQVRGRCRKISRSSPSTFHATPSECYHLGPNQRGWGTPTMYLGEVEPQKIELVGIIWSH